MSESSKLVEFLEEYPLYRKLRGFPESEIKVGDFEDRRDNEITKVAQVSIELPCPECKRTRTFASLEPQLLRQENSEPDEEYWIDPYVAHILYFLPYRCTHCKRHRTDFLLIFHYTGKYIQKVGQNPPWSILVSKTVERFLGEDLTLLKQGRVCESQGYGIAAFVYYRRVVENIVDQLLNRLESLVPETERRAYGQALLDVRESREASEKIRAVKDLLPSTLRPHGDNPLSILYNAVSHGLHQESDEECLEDAAQIYSCLTYLVEAISSHDENAKDFTDNLRQVLNRTAARRTGRAKNDNQGNQNS